MNEIIYRIDMKEEKVFKSVVPEEYDLLGGRGLTSRILLDEVDPGCEPLGHKNKIIIAPGLLSGTIAPCSGRLSIGGKSPLTGGVKESNSGGTAAIKLAKLGIKAIIIENQHEKEKWYTLKVNKEGVKLIDAIDVIGMGNYETVKYYQKKYGKKISIISIGPAGENQYRASTIAVTDMQGLPTRHCARGGLGSLMGSKKIKAIAIESDNTFDIEIKDRVKFKKIAKEWIKILIPSKKVLRNYGTPSLIEPMNKLGCLPTHNFRLGNFKKVSSINADRLKKNNS